MPTYTISKLKDDVTGIIHGGTLNKVKNFYSIARRAGWQLLQDVDPQETRRRFIIPNAIFTDVYDYACPSDLKGNMVVDIAPTGYREPTDNVDQMTSKEFDRYKWDGQFDIDYNNSIKVLRLSKNVGEQTVLNQCDDLTANGTAVVGGNASNLSLDKITYITNNSSLKFDLDNTGVPASTGYLEITGSPSVDLSNYLNTGSMFWWLYIPDATALANITSVNIRWGTDYANSYNSTVTTPNFGTFEQGWNIIRHDWNAAAVVGAPDPTNVTYVRFTITYAGSASQNLRIDSCVAKLGVMYEMDYYSKFLFQNSSGTWIEEPTADTDYINLDTDSYNIYLYKVSEFVSQQIPDRTDETNFSNRYQVAVNSYNTTYKSEYIKPKSMWIRSPYKF